MIGNRTTLYRTVASAAALIFSWLLQCRACADILSSNNISSHYVGQDPIPFGKALNGEINIASFFGKLFVDYDKPPDLSKVQLKVKVELAIKKGDEHGLLSISFESNGLPVRERDHAFQQVSRYAELRARGHSKAYVERLMFIEDIAKTKNALDPIARAIASKFQDVLPSALTHVGEVRKEALKIVSFQLCDGNYCWTYDVVVSERGQVEEINERREIKERKKR